MATYIAQFNEYTHKVQTLKVSSNFKVATALATAGDYKRIYDLLSIMFDYKAIENLKLDKGVILPDGKGVKRTSHKMTTFDCKNLFDAFGALQDLSTRNDILIVIVTNPRPLMYIDFQNNLDESVPKYMNWKSGTIYQWAK